MFKENKDHLQKELFPIELQLSKKARERLLNSKEHFFYEYLFCNIDESIFEKIYSDKASRPNSPVNILVAAIILRNYYKWSYETLFNQIYLNVAVRHSIGINNLDEDVFSEQTIFNFQNRLSSHSAETGENLFEEVFQKLTKKQIKELKIKTDIQRGDSIFIDSNIRHYSRLQLLIEVLKRLYRALSDEDKVALEHLFSGYIKLTSGQYIYKVKGDSLDEELSKIGERYHQIEKELPKNYRETLIYETFRRVYTEHFTICDEKIEVKSNDSMSSGCLQSPDDLDATYRNKRGESHKGQKLHFSETANPENDIQLLTDVSIDKNNVDDSDMLNDRLETMKENTADLEEYHNDGGYGSEENDKDMEKYGIKQIQTAIKGRTKKVNFTIEKSDNGDFYVSCQNCRVKAVVYKDKYRAYIPFAACGECPYFDDCPVKYTKKGMHITFTYKDYLRQERNNNINTIPDDRKTIRCNAEATAKEFVCRTDNRKLKVRGKQKAQDFAYTTAIGINFGRIYRHSRKGLFKREDNGLNRRKSSSILILFAFFIVKIRVKNIKY